MKIALFLSLVIATTSFADELSKSSPIETILTEDAIRTIRDPFQAPASLTKKEENPTSDLETSTLKDFVLNGVIVDAKKRAKAMVSLPNGKTFFVTIGTRVGKREGHVTGISSDSINVVEYDYDEHGKRVPKYYGLSISGDLVSLTNKEER